MAASEEAAEVETSEGTKPIATTVVATVVAMVAQGACFLAVKKIKGMVIIDGLSLGSYVCDFAKN